MNDTAAWKRFADSIQVTQVETNASRCSARWPILRLCSKCHKSSALKCEFVATTTDDRNLACDNCDRPFALDHEARHDLS